MTTLNRMMHWARDADTRMRRRLSDKRRILLNARTPMNYAVMASIHRALSEDPRIKFYFTASEQPKRLKEVYADARPPARFVSPAQAALMKFDAYLAADLLWLTLPRGSQRTLLFHGVAGKYGHIYDAPDRSMREWDRLFFINRRRMRNYFNSGAIDPDSKAARLVGYPKLDCLVDGSLNRDAILTAMGLDSSRRTVMYAPTWSPYSSLNAMGVDLVGNLCQAGYNVIVKLHDRSLDAAYIHSGGVDWAARLEPVLKPGQGCLATGSDACPYLAAADLLITDHSSVGFEYLLLDRPIVRIEMPELIRATNIHADYVSMLASASFTARHAKEVIPIVELGFSHPARHKSARRAVADELFYKPGTATARAVLELYEILELAPPVALQSLRAEAQATISSRSSGDLMQTFSC